MAYTTLNKAHTHHKTRTADGKPTTRYSRYETGLITGRNRDLPVVLADCTGFDGLGFDSTVGSNDDTWYMLNAFDSKGAYVDTIAVGGAMDGDHATLVAQTQLDHLGASSVALIGLGLTQFDSINQSQAGTFSIDAINKLMDNPSQDKGYIPIITASELAFENDRVTFDSVQWADNSDELLSHDGRDSSLLLDMTRADTRNDLVNEFELADTLQLLGAEPEQSFDSLMAIKSRLEPLKSRLFQAMVRAGDTPPKMPFNKGDKAPAHDPKLLYVTNVTETKPFKRQGVTNIAFVFDLSDGQKLSIWFHNPDSTPSKLMPSDIMISWKWMLNKRDVTAALSPKQGDNVQLPVLASRIMRIAAKNSQRFKRTQARQLKLEQDLLDAQTLIDTKNTAIDQLDKDIESLTSQIDEAMKTPDAETVNESGLQADDNDVNADTAVTDVSPISDETDLQLKQSVTNFAENHAGFEGFIKSNNDAEQALASKPKGHWVAKIENNPDGVMVFMSLDDDSASYTGSSSNDVELAYNDIFEKTKNSAERWGTEDDLVDMNKDTSTGYDIETASNDEVINDARIQALITDLGLTLASSENSEYEFAKTTDNSAFSFKLKHGELSTVYFVQDGGKTNLDTAMTEINDINGFINQAKDMHAKYLELLNDDDAPDPDNTPTNPNNKKITKGKNNKAKTPKGTKIESRFALVDAKFLIASHTASGTKNPKYPQDLQPRDRARESSIAWVQKTSKALDPESLGRTGRVDTGAPIVGDDLVVESGNGRTIAIKMAYANGDAGEYKEWLAENADMFGMTEAQVNSCKHPVLVRIRTTEVNRAEFAVEANQDDKLSFTASERAKSDAKRINAGMLELFDPNESGDILAASNRDFVKSFLASLGTTEAAQYTDSNGNPTQALVARIKSALFSKAYDDDRLLEMMADQTKPDLQNMLNALTMAAPNFVAAQAVSRSDTQDLADKVVDSIEQSLSDEVKAAIVDATNMIMNAKLSNQDIKEYVLQQGLFEQVDDAVSDLAVFLASNARSAKKMADYFNAMANYIEKDSVSRQNLDMFGEPEPLSLADIITHANQAVSSNDDSAQTPDMFNEPVVEPSDPPAQPVALTDDLDTTNLAAKIDAIAEEVDSDDFDPEVFDVDALMTIVEEVAGNADLTAKLDDISKTYQAKLIAISMQALSDMAGQ